MTHDPLAAGDLIAERRFAYARAAADEGDFAAAAEIFEQALERAPDWAAASFALGEARERLGGIDAAAEAFRRRASLRPSRRAGGRGATCAPGRATRRPPLHAYIARLFDGYAQRFEAHLTGTLSYRAPAFIAEALSATAPGRRFVSALDLGCGTGLIGEAPRARVDRLTGVDLSPAMIEKARERGVYDALIVGDATAFLARSAPGRIRLHSGCRRALLFRRLEADLSPPAGARSVRGASSLSRSRPSRATAFGSRRRCVSRTPEQAWKRRPPRSSFVR